VKNPPLLVADVSRAAKAGWGVFFWGGGGDY